MRIRYYGLATADFKSYIDRSDNADSEAQNAFYVVAQVLATYKIEAEEGTYTQSPSLLLVKMTFDFENASRLQSKLKAVEKSLTLYFKYNADAVFRTALPLKYQGSKDSLSDLVTCYELRIIYCRALSVLRLIIL